MPKMPLLDNLNPEQRHAVCQPPGPQLILAGAGTGKTRVLTHKLAYLIEEGADPGSILAVTFTNKAAKEMKERVQGLAGYAAERCWIGTFHSVCARMLRQNAAELGYSRNFSIYDSNDQKRIIKRVISCLNLSEQSNPVSFAQSRISDAKNKLIREDQYIKHYSDFNARNMADIYTAYQRELAGSNAMDFDDLIMKTVLLLEENSRIHGFFQEKIHHILVDEYQDTNAAQFKLLLRLSERRRFISVVGDDDQSIYQWRGADLQNMLDFEKHFPGAAVFRLQRNYRSTPTILRAANSLIKNNIARKAKELWTRNEDGEKITILQAQDEIQEAELVVNAISERKGSKYAEHAVLYRTNAQSRALEDAFRLKGIPYVIVGGVRFYERREVKDILAYLYFLANPLDSLCLTRIINVPKRGIGSKTMDRIVQHAATSGAGLFDSMQKAKTIDGLSTNAAGKVAGFCDLLNTLMAQKSQVPPSVLTEEIITQTGYLAELEKEPIEVAEERRNNVMELVRAIEIYCERAEAPGLDGFLEEVALISDIDTWDDDKDAVSLMTVHSSKGLEFSFLTITGMEQGLFPLQNKSDLSDELEEERRLFYVGLTRARKKVCLSYAMNRRRYGLTGQGIPSTFLKELDEDTFESDAIWPQKDFSSFRPQRERVTKKRRHEPQYEDYSQEEKMFRIGGHVKHFVWGTGRILGISGFGLDTELVVAFGNEKKKVVAKYANLEIL